MHRATQEAQRVADAVTSLGRGPAGMDFYRLRRDRQDLERFLSERLAARPDLRFVDVRDRFGTPSSARAGQRDPRTPRGR